MVEGVQRVKVAERGWLGFGGKGVRILSHIMSSVLDDEALKTENPLHSPS